MGRFDKATELNILAAARNPQWIEQAADEDPPTSTGAGTDTASVLVCAVEVSLQEAASQRTAYIVPPLAVTSAILITTDAGTISYTTDPADTLDEAIDFLIAQAAADVASGIAVVGVDATGAEAAPFTRARLRWDVGTGPSDDWITASSATGTITVEVDPSTCDVALWGLPGGGASNRPDRWTLLDDGAVDIDGSWSQQVNVATRRRIFVQTANVEGRPLDSAGTNCTLTYRDPTITVGPCVLE